MPKGLGSSGRPSGCVPRPAGQQLGGVSSAHLQAQHIRRVTLLTLQPVHARTSLWMSSTMSLVPIPLSAPDVTYGALESPLAPRHRPTPQGHGGVWGSAGAGRANREGDTVEVMDTNKPGAGLTGLPGKPISPFIPARPGGPWKEEKMRMRMPSMGAPPLPRIIPIPPCGIQGGGW